MTTVKTRGGMDLADYVHELTSSHQHREHYQIRVGGGWIGCDHPTHSPALIHQLWHASPSGMGDDRSGGGYESRPSASIEALDTATRIDLQASRWVRDLGAHDPSDRVDPATLQVVRGSGTIACIRRLHGLTRSADAVTRRAIERDVRRWWTQARVVTGWDSPAWRPDNTCPACDQRGSLRVKLADQVGFCVECQETWDSKTIGLLADHIRVESQAERVQAVGLGPCWCPWPAPGVPDLGFLCPACGSARCRHALGARLVDTLRRRVGA